MRARRLLSIILVAVSCLAACGDAATEPAPASRVPGTHPAVDLAARSRNSDEFAAGARDRHLRFACGRGGPDSRWEVCLVRSAGVVAVVGFGDTARIAVRLTGESHDRVPVPLEPGTVYGVLEPSGSVRLVIESGGRQIGELEAQL